MSRFLQRQPLLLTPLAPIHIGAGNDLDWTRAVQVGQDMILFDPLRANLPARALADMDKASSLPDGAEAIQRLQRVFQTYRRDLAAAKTGSIRLTEAVADKFESGAGKNTQRHQRGGPKVATALQIERCITNPADEQPFIPGSSLKGALRTAEVARRDAEENPGPYRAPRAGKTDPSDGLIGRFHESLFARVALSDLNPVMPLPTIAAYVRNERRQYKEFRGRIQRSNGVSIAAELVPAFHAGAFRGDVRIIGQRGSRDQQPIADLAQLMQATHQFHSQLFAEHVSVLGQEDRDLMPGWADALRQLLQAPELQPQLKAGRAALVRLGKYGSAESKTVEWRNVWIPQAKERDQQWVLNPYTLWLADLGAEGCLPLGWALLELADAPSAAVRQFCNQFRAAPAADAAEDTPATLTPTIITDRSSDNGARMAMLEDECDAGRPVGDLLKNLAKQSTRWPHADRLLLAQLVKEKARARSGLKSYEWKNLDKLLLPLPDAE